MTNVDRGAEVPAYRNLPESPEVAESAGRLERPRDMSDMTSLKTFVTSLAGHVAAEAAPAS